MCDLSIALVCEGPSDKPLLGVLRSLVLAAGATKVTGEAISRVGTVKSKIEHIQRHGARYDLLFLHRDADNRDYEPRYREIEAAVAATGWEGQVVSVVPVQATEAWLLTDEAAIREVAGRRNGRVALGLPGLTAIERTANPKVVLKTAYLAATETTGRRRDTAEGLFGQRRATLIERIDHRAGVAQLPSFQRLVQDVNAAVARCCAAPT